ncbi:Protein SMG7 [Vitis vinifera]|uniref:Protein SMG7 n=1 Tax=Vitis vinifera TaxID=29760 RepID=A0A438I629_VITVI|nr:Protein SMG7 [Vitis vinifera]
MPAWVRVLELLVHLWGKAFFRRLGEARGGFVVVDMDTEEKGGNVLVRWCKCQVSSLASLRTFVGCQFFKQGQKPLRGFGSSKGCLGGPGLLSLPLGRPKDLTSTPLENMGKKVRVSGVDEATDFEGRPSSFPYSLPYTPVASKDVAPRWKVIGPNGKCRKGYFGRDLAVRAEDVEDFRLLETNRDLVGEIVFFESLPFVLLVFRELLMGVFSSLVNVELESKRRRSAQARISFDPNAWQQMRENYEAIILEDNAFSEQHEIEYALWQLHYRRIEELRAHFSAALASSASNTSQSLKGSARPDRIGKIRAQFKTFLSEATGFYHDLMLKIRAKYGLPLGYFSEDKDNQIVMSRDGNKSADIKKGMIPATVV